MITNWPLEFAFAVNCWILAHNFSCLEFLVIRAQWCSCRKCRQLHSHRIREKWVIPSFGLSTISAYRQLTRHRARALLLTLGLAVGKQTDG